MNPYMKEINDNLPRIIALFDSDQTSASYGMGDRFYWGWGLIDFGNGVFQGMAHGFARLWVNGIWPYPTTLQKMLKRIDSIFLGTNRLIRKNGSIDQAFPYESSFAGTGIVAFDLLSAIELMEPQVDQNQRAKWLQIINPMIQYLINADETHGIISNHLAACSAALAKWFSFTGDNDSYARSKTILERILHNQSEEGWFLEYNGADPGYQSLCTYYLASIYLKYPGLIALDPLKRSIRFLWHFAHPDGSFGGLYGSRSTRFFCPAGILALSPYIPEAMSLSYFMDKSIESKRVVTLSAIDEPNLGPMFNSYCWAASLWEKRNSDNLQPIPAIKKGAFRIYFKDAGFLIDKGRMHYTIVSTKKGGVTYHFVGDKMDLLDSGVVVTDKKGRWGSSQIFADNATSFEEDTIIIYSRISSMTKRLPGVFQFIALRCMSLLIFRLLPSVREVVKKLLASYLITRKNLWPIRNKRRIMLGEDLSIVDELHGLKPEHTLRHFSCHVAVHMASKGYWQIQDETETSVEQGGVEGRKEE